MIIGDCSDCKMIVDVLNFVGDRASDCRDCKMIVDILYIVGDRNDCLSL